MPKTKSDYQQERRINQQTSYIARICLQTRVPSKWRFIDLETDEVWEWQPSASESRPNSGVFKRVTDIEVTLREEKV